MHLRASYKHVFMRPRMLRTLVFLVVGTFCLSDVSAQSSSRNQRTGPSFAVELISKKREYNVGEQWVGELKATATAQANGPMTIRAWSRFFADYDVVPEAHGPIGDANLSDVRA